MENVFGAPVATEEKKAPVKESKSDVKPFWVKSSALSHLAKLGKERKIFPNMGPVNDSFVKFISIIWPDNIGAVSFLDLILKLEDKRLLATYYAPKSEDKETDKEKAEETKLYLHELLKGQAAHENLGIITKDQAADINFMLEISFEDYKRLKAHWASVMKFGIYTEDFVSKHHMYPFDAFDQRLKTANAVPFNMAEVLANITDTTLEEQGLTILFDEPRKDILKIFKTLKQETTAPKTS